MMWPKRRQSIRFQYQMQVVILFIGVALVSFLLYFLLQNTQHNLIEQRDLLKEKKDEFYDMQQNLSDVFFRARGYYALLDENELKRLYTSMNKLEVNLFQLKSMENLSRDEKQTVDDVTIFISNYRTSSLPAMLTYARNGDYENLRKTAQEGLNDTVNEVNDVAIQNDRALQSQLDDISTELMKASNRFALYFFLAIAFVLIGKTILTMRTTNRILQPIETLEKEMSYYTEHHTLNSMPSNEANEIGSLSRAFHNFVRMIQQKEEELVAKNEELITQQDELQDGKAKLQQALAENELSKMQLEQTNEFDRSISFTLDIHEMSERMMSFFKKTYAIDLGILWFPAVDEIATFGLTDEMVRIIRSDRMPYLQERLKNTPYFIMKREANFSNGLAFEHNFVYELYVGIKNEQEEFIAIAGIARSGYSFSETEQEEIYQLLMKAHLALDRIYLYDEAVKERLLNAEIINNIQEGIQYVDNTGKILQQNDAFNELNQQTDEYEKTHLFYHWTAVLTERVADSQPLLEFFTNSIETNTLHQQYMEYEISSVPPKFMSVYSTPVVVHDEKIGTIFVYRDITQQHEVDRMKSELVNTVSHELRTPLSSVVGFAELMLKKKLPEEKQRKYVSMILQEGTRLTHLINDFLDLQRMEAGKQTYVMEPLSFNEVLEDTLLPYEELNTHPIEVENETIQDTVIGDRDRLKQLLLNIMSNAVKFSPKEKPIRIRVRNEDSMLIVEVQDQGIGIPKNELPLLFQKFHRVDNSDRRTIGGTGLGLAISKEITEAHKGTIVIDSELGEGTTVTLTFPLDAKEKGFLT